jgi:hypothetical protein
LYLFRRFTLADDRGDLHPATFYHVERVTRITFAENLFAVRKTRFARDALERRQFVWRQRTEQFAGLQWEHG